MNFSTPGLPVHHQLPEFTETQSIESLMPSSHLILCRSLFLLAQSLQASASFAMSQLFAWGSQSTGVSALASFLPKNTQGWSPSEWTGCISLQSKGLSGVFSNTTVQKHQFFGAKLSSQSNSHIHGLGEQFHITFITPPLKAHSWASGETVLTCDFSTEESEGLWVRIRSPALGEPTEKPHPFLTSPRILICAAQLGSGECLGTAARSPGGH